MISDKKIKYFQNTLLKWFEGNGRNFQWRNNSLTSYEIIISEILLQRTKAETVSKFYSQFIKNFPSWRVLASANYEDIEQYLIPIGLYRQRAKRLKNLADYMVGHGEKLPVVRIELEKVPFMGQYIANAVELLIYNANKPLLDVNMARVLERYFGPRQLADIRYDPYLQLLSHRIVNHHQAKMINWSILDFAAIICTARNPRCNECVFQNTCLYYRNNKRA